MILNTERGQSLVDIFMRNVGFKNGLSETTSSNLIQWSNKNATVDGFYLEHSHHNSSLQFLCINGEPILDHEEIKMTNNSVKKMIKYKNKEVIIRNTIFVLLVTVKNESKFHQVIEECFSSFTRNCQVVGNSESSSFATVSTLAYSEEFDGIKPLECTSTADGSQMCFENNEPFNQMMFTPCKSSGRIGAPAIPTGPGPLNTSHDISKAVNEIIFHDDWDNPNFYIFNNADNGPFPSMNAKQFKAKDEIKLTKSDIVPESVICQVDNKYILSRTGASSSGDLLLAWDQHAVHERINLEFLLLDCLAPHSLAAPLSVQLSVYELAVISSVSEQVTRWGLGLALTEDPETVIVTEVPGGARDLGPEMTVDLVTHILEELTELATVVHGVFPTVPRALFNLLASKACRGSIMFGQERCSIGMISPDINFTFLTNPFKLIIPIKRVQSLSVLTCESLLRDLAGCFSPWQCAHGRPSVHLLCNLGRVSRHQVSNPQSVWRNHSIGPMSDVTCVKIVDIQPNSLNRKEGSRILRPKWSRLKSTSGN